MTAKIRHVGDEWWLMEEDGVLIHDVFLTEERAKAAARARSEIEAARDMKAKMEAAGAKVVRIWANGHDVTDKMPLTRAELEKQRRNQ